MSQLEYDPAIEATKKEALEILSIKEGTLRNYVEKNRLKVRYVKGKTSNIALYKREDLERVKEENDKALNPSTAKTSKVSNPVEVEVLNPSNLSNTSNISNLSTAIALPSQVPLQRAVGQGSDEFVALLADAYAESMRISSATDPVRLTAKMTVTPAEASIITGFSEGVIRQAIKDGQLSAPKLGRGYRILTADLEPWVKTFYGK